MNSNKILALYPNVEDHINIREAFDGSNNEIVCVTCVVDAVKLLMKQDYSLVFVDSRIATVDNATITTLKTITCAPIAIVSALIHQKVNEKNASDNIHTHHEHTHIPTFNENHAARIHYHHVLNFSGELIIDPNRREVLLAGEELKLTKIEFDIIYFLARHKGRVMSRDQIYANVWTHDTSFDIDEMVKAHIKRIRKKFVGANRDYIQNIRGIGYKFIG